MHARAAALLADDGVQDQRVAEHLLQRAGAAETRRRDDAATGRRTARRVGAYETATRLLERAGPSHRRRQSSTPSTSSAGGMLDAGGEDGARVLARVARAAHRIV